LINDLDKEINEDSKAMLKLQFEYVDEEKKLLWTKMHIIRIKEKHNRAMFVLSMILVDIKVFKVIADSEEEMKQRFTERFKCFESCIYIKRHTYEDFVEQKKAHMKYSIKERLLMAKELFMKAKSFSDGVVNNELYHKRYELEVLNLRKTVIANSLVVIGLIMKKEQFDGLRVEFVRCVDRLPIYQ